MMTTDEVKDWLAESFESTAEWRERKAAEHPDDKRNLDARKAHLALRDSVVSIPNSLVSSYVAVREQLDPGRAVEIEGDAFREIGFHRAPESATAFLKVLLAELRDTSPPGPTLRLIAGGQA